MGWLYERSKRCAGISREQLKRAVADEDAAVVAAFMAEQALEYLIRQILQDLSVSYKNYDITSLSYALDKSQFAFKKRQTLMDNAAKYTKWKDDYFKFGRFSVSYKEVDECLVVVHCLDSARVDDKVNQILEEDSET